MFKLLNNITFYSIPILVHCQRLLQATYIHSNTVNHTVFVNGPTLKLVAVHGVEIVSDFSSWLYYKMSYKNLQF